MLIQNRRQGVWRRPCQRRQASHSTGGCTLTEALDDYAIHLAAGGRESATIESYRRSLGWLKEALGDPALSTISPERIGFAVLRLANAGTAGAVPARCATTMNRIKSTYRSFFRWALETGRVARNPAAHLCRSRAESSPTLPITPSEVEQLLAAIRCSGDAHAARDEALLATYAFTGMRRSEALSLRAADFDAASRTVAFHPKKGGPPRFLPVPHRLAEALVSHMLRLPARRRDDRPLFVLFPGRAPKVALSARQVQTRFEKWKRASGLRPGLTVHSFRAGFATSLYEATKDLFLVARALGHRDIRSTLRYVEMSPSRLRGVIEKVFG